MQLHVFILLLSPALAAWRAEFSSSNDMVDIGVFDMNAAILNYWNYINPGEKLINGGYWSDRYSESFVDGNCHGGRGQEISFLIEIKGVQLEGADSKCDYWCLRHNSWGLLQETIRKTMERNQRRACKNWFCRSENCDRPWEKSVLNETAPMDAANRCTCYLWDGDRVQATKIPRYSRVYLTGGGKTGSFEIRISEYKGSSSICQMANFATTWVGILGGQAGAIIGGAGGQLAGEYCQ